MGVERGQVRREIPLDPTSSSTTEDRKAYVSINVALSLKIASHCILNRGNVEGSFTNRKMHLDIFFYL